MTTARPHGLFQNGFDLVDNADRVIASFNGSFWGERGQVTSDSGDWEFRREGSGRFALVDQGAAIVVAERRGLFSSKWEVTYNSRGYLLTKAGVFSRAYQVLGEGRVLGEIAPKGFGARQANVELPADFPPHVQMFVVAVVLTLLRRQQSAASAGAGGAAAAGSSGL